MAKVSMKKLFQSIEETSFDSRKKKAKEELSEFLGDDFSIEEVKKWSNFLLSEENIITDREVCGVFLIKGKPTVYLFGDILKVEAGKVYVLFRNPVAQIPARLSFQGEDYLTMSISDEVRGLIIPPVFEDDAQIVRKNAKKRLLAAFSEMGKHFEDGRFDEIAALIPVNEMNEISKKMGKINRKIEDAVKTRLPDTGPNDQQE